MPGPSHRSISAAAHARTHTHTRATHSKLNDRTEAAASCYHAIVLSYSRGADQTSEKLCGWAGLGCGCGLGWAGLFRLALLTSAVVFRVVVEFQPDLLGPERTQARTVPLHLEYTHGRQAQSPAHSSPVQNSFTRLPY